MSRVDTGDFVFVEVTKTFMMTKEQARKLVSVARLLYSDRQIVSLEDDGTEIQTYGEDFLTEDGNNDYASALAELPDPEGLMGAELLQLASINLDPERVAEITKLWPDNWQIEAMLRLNNLGDSVIDGGEQ